MRRPMIRLRHPRSLRLRLTLTFASVIALVLLVAGFLVYAQFRRDLDSRTDAELTERAIAVSRLAQGRTSAATLAVSGESLAQVYGTGGELSATTSRLPGTRLLTPAEVERARRAPLLLTAQTVPVTDDGARVRAFAISARRVAVIAESRTDREHALHRLAAILALTLPGALLLASLTGYQVATAALAPVERMRRRAAAISESDPGERLPLPGTNDELDRLAVTLNELLDRLHAALEREQRIVGDASHELRTPISVLRTRIDVALRGDPAPERLVAALEGAHDDAVRLGRLADDLLVLARADQGRLTLRREPLDAQDVLEQARERHAEIAAAADRSIVIVNRTGGGAVLLADADRLAQAIDNLVVNALRYGTGEIELAVEADPVGRVALSVRDHGAGFPPEFLAHAFERFSQADVSHGGAGSGLGLALVDAVARAHGGRATVGNDPGGGAVATIAIPQA